MPWFSRKSDPISDRARTLNEQIAELEAQIKSLDTRLQQQTPPPRLRSTALPHSIQLQRLANPAPIPIAAHPEPVFEEMHSGRLQKPGEAPASDAHYNQLGVRKYDLPASFRRLMDHLRGPAATNPKLVSYLAAGGIQGLRPLRYEKRVARNRFILFAMVLFVMLLGLAAVFFGKK